MDYEALAQQLEATGDYKVVTRFEPASSYAPLDEVEPAQLRTVMVVDTETTGLVKETDKIIDLGYVLPAPLERHALTQFAQNYA